MAYNKTISALIVAFILLLAGCASISSPDKKAVRPDIEKIDLKIGQAQTKTVGEPMIIKATLFGFPGFTASNDYQVPGYLGVRYPYITNGSSWRCDSVLENGNYLCTNPNLITQFQYTYCLVITPAGEGVGDASCSSWFVVREWSDGPQKIFTPTKIYREGSFRQELIYNGKAKDSIRLTYREFKNDMARPAFFQDLAYDLSESKTIGFRGMLIDVVEATNSTITFIVKSEMK